eukprot:CAMPEP_0183724308 /NCGR_PEP_ID=MMETSP0737-20130205/17849_1 /TAXON_ID=385413 /ORGANISM="Thalassiosira miniscula, Strain CCMP1093" /LENGTH=292 /DNA_ID=CAMNT_0025954865 /DNA_START=64 /DNA_END=942 /DNA_ORIENTATION=+
MAPSTSLLSAACAALAIVSPASAFVPTSSIASRQSSLSMVSKDGEISTSTRRGFFDNVASATAAIAGASTVLMNPSPAMAYGLNKANDRLASYGLPKLAGVPNGYSALAEIYGKGANRSPLLVAFGFPLDWVVTLPSQDVNGEDGTIQAGEYAKGDTATFFVVPNEGKADIQEKEKSFFKDALIAAISQKGSNIYQDFKVTKTEPVSVDGGKYVLVDFKYTLLTGAGFEVERKGVASVTSAGDGVQLLWAASIAARYKNKTEGSLRSIVQSFRCYADGLNFSADLRPAAEDF